MAFEVKMPQLGLTMEEGTVGKWLKKEGDEVKIGDKLVVIETDKLTNEIESEFEGVLLKIIAPQGTNVPVQGIIAYIGKAGEQVGDAPATAPVAMPVAAPVAVSLAPAMTIAPGRRVKISPLAKKTAAKLGVDYAAFIGSGAGGRIVQKDILAASTTAAAPVPVLSSALIEFMEGDEVVKATGMRKIVAQRVSKSHSEIPAVTTTSKIDVTELLEFRQKINEKMERKYSINDFILKAVAKALQVNRDILVSWDGDNIIKRAHINLGMAVALDAGLIVPVIKDADK